MTRSATVDTLTRARRAKRQPPPPPDPVTQYALDVVAGRVTAGVLVRKACERHLSDLATGHERGLHFDAAAAIKAIAFFPLLRHYKGEWGPLPGVRRYGLPIVLEPWQQFAVGCAFGWKRADGSRRFRTVYVEVGAKNGKSLTGAGVGLLLGFFDGEPGAEVYSGATKRDQAKLVWNDARHMVLAAPGLQKRITPAAGSLYNLATASSFKPLGQDADSDQGINVHGAIIDELHVHANRDMIDNLEKATFARRQPLIWKITTAGVKRDSVWAQERADAVAVVEGRATDDSMLVLIYTLDEGDDPFDEAVWPKANPNLGVSISLETLRIAAAKAQRSPGYKGAYLRYHMNVPTSVATKAIDIDEWDACDGLGVVVEDDDERPETYQEWEARTFATLDEEGVKRVRLGGYGGLDLASVRDLTALILVLRGEGDVYDVLCRFWCPAEGVEERSRRDGVPYADWVRDGYLIETPGNVTDYEFVKQAIRDLADVHALGEIGFDRWNATQLATDLMAEGASLVPIPQTHAGLAPAWRELTKWILERSFRHGGHPILRWMAGNVETELDPVGNEKPSKRMSAERIDGMVALDMAIARWMANGSAPAVWSAA